MAPKAKRTAPSNSTILYRSETNKVLGGICGGLAEVFQVDATLVRILFALAFMFGGSGLLFYIILWIIIPARSKLSNTSDENIRQNIDEMKDRAKEFTREFQVGAKGQRSGAGIILVLLGLFFLLSNFGYVHIYNMHRFWPLLLIILGIGFLARRNNRS